jgi:hypothetical protein
MRATLHSLAEVDARSVSGAPAATFVLRGLTRLPDCSSVEAPGSTSDCGPHTCSPVSSLHEAR